MCSILETIINTVIPVLCSLFIFYRQRNIDIERQKKEDDQHKKEMQLQQEHYENNLNELRESNRIAVIPVFTVMDKKVERNDEENKDRLCVKLKNVGNNSAIQVEFSIDESEFTDSIEAIDITTKEPKTMHSDLLSSPLIRVNAEFQIKADIMDIGKNMESMNYSDVKVKIKLRFRDVLFNQYIQSFELEFNRVNNTIPDEQITVKANAPCLIKDDDSCK